MGLLMTRAGHAVAAERIRPSHKAILPSDQAVAGHIKHLAAPAYQRLLGAEQLLRRSIPILVVLFVVILALARAVTLVAEHARLDKSSQDYLTMIADTMEAKIRQRMLAGGTAAADHQGALNDLLSSSRPNLDNHNGRIVLLTNEAGQVVASLPVMKAWEKKPLTETLGLYQPLTALGARAGVQLLTLADGTEAYATTRFLDAPLGSVTVLHPTKDVFAEWREAMSVSVTLFVGTSAILLVLSFAFYAQAARAQSADRLYADSFQRHTTALKRGRCGLWDWDLSRGRLYWSASMADILGLQKQDDVISFAMLSGLVHPDDIDLKDLANQLLTSDTVTIDTAFRMRAAGGEWMWLRLRAEIVDCAETGSRHLIGIAADISEQKRMVDAATTADMRLRDAVETISEAFVLWDGEQRLVMCNSNFREFHNLDESVAVAGASYDDVMGQSRATVQISQIARTERTAPGECAFEVLLDDGRWLQINERRTKDGGLVSVGTDITAIKTHEENLMESERRLMATVTDLRQSRQKLELQAQQLVELAEKYSHEKQKAQDANRIKSEFLANMSHELRTPLNAIIGFSDVMIHGYVGETMGPKYQEYCRDIHSSGKHLLAVINDILDMSKIEAGRMTLDKEPIDLDALIEETVRIIAVEADQKSIRLTADLEPSLMVHADRRAIKQTLLNLMSNALKFTPQDGFVKLTARATADGATLVIEDSGIGIAKDDLAVLGQPFVQVENQFTKCHKGSGLGLAIARSLVEMHGGTMAIASELGVGTQVTVDLPSGLVAA
jgi:two-component system, cell cycle sensor histidine kinase PleC